MFFSLLASAGCPKAQLSGHSACFGADRCETGFLSAKNDLSPVVDIFKPVQEAGGFRHSPELWPKNLGETSRAMAKLLYMQLLPLMRTFFSLLLLVLPVAVLDSC